MLTDKNQDWIDQQSRKWGSWDNDTLTLTDRNREQIHPKSRIGSCFQWGSIGREERGDSDSYQLMVTGDRQYWHPGREENESSEIVPF